MTPNNIVNMAKLIGLDSIAISDHNTTGNVISAMKVGEEAGLEVIPGMEVETIEGIHILTLYKDIDTALKMGEAVFSRLPKIKNKPEIFGEQIYMDENDRKTGIEETLLISSTDISVEELFELTKSCGALFIPAHIDRHSYSILTNLGFIPPELKIKYIEISKNVTDANEYISSRPDLRSYNVLRNSDAHYLEKMSERENFLDLKSAKDLFL